MYVWERKSAIFIIFVSNYTWENKDLQRSENLPKILLLTITKSFTLVYVLLLHYALSCN